MKKEKFKTNGSLSALGKLPPDELGDELLKYRYDELVRIAIAGVFASSLMAEQNIKGLENEEE